MQKIKLIPLLLISTNAMALGVDEVQKYVQCDSKKIFTEIVNDQETKSFVEVTVGEYSSYKDGILQAEIKPYDDNNQFNRKIIARPSKVILNVNEKKTINFHTLGKPCTSEVDQIFSTTFTPFSVPGEANTANILFGIGGILTIMPKNPKLDYEISRKDDMVTIKNSGDSVIFFDVEVCKEEGEGSECTKRGRIHHTMSKTFSVSEYPIDGKITISAPSTASWRHNEVMNEI